MPTNDDSARKAKLEADREFVKAKTRQAAERAKLTALEYARRRGELIERDTAVRQASYLIIAVRQHMLALAGVLPRKLVGRSEHEMKQAIDSAVRACLNELAELPNVITRSDYERYVDSEQK
jgi:hypothetical protein